jgi:hypothetical protein
MNQYGTIILRGILKEMYENVNWINMVQDRDKWCTLVNTIITLWVPQKAGDASRN